MVEWAQPGLADPTVSGKEEDGGAPGGGGGAEPFDSSKAEGPLVSVRLLHVVVSVGSEGTSSGKVEEVPVLDLPEDSRIRIRIPGGKYLMALSRHRIMAVLPLVFQCVNFSRQPLTATSVSSQRSHGGSHGAPTEMLWITTSDSASEPWRAWWPNPMFGKVMMEGFGPGWETRPGR